MRPLIEQGHIYFAQPPLYRLTRGKKLRYAFSDEERDQELKEMSEDGKYKVDIQRYKGLGEMDRFSFGRRQWTPTTGRLSRLN